MALLSLIIYRIKLNKLTEEKEVIHLPEKIKPKDEKQEETTLETDKEQVEEKTEDTQKKEKMLKGKTKESKPEEKKSEKKDDDFQYIIRLSNTDIDGKKNIVYGLTSIKGIGVHISHLILEQTGINKNIKIGKLSESQTKELQDAIDNISKNAPRWMLNHRKDYDTGEDIHLISQEIDMKLRDEINIMKKIRSYRGIRHERGLPVRGQRTRANNRRGLSLGVSKKRNIAQNK